MLPPFLGQVQDNRRRWSRQCPREGTFGGTVAFFAWRQLAGREGWRKLQSLTRKLMPLSDQDFWNGRFASESYVFGTRPAAFLVDNAPYIPPRSRVLVPADGEGRNSVFLAEMGHRVVATDLAEAGIAKAQKLADARGVSGEFRHLDLQGWQWPQAAFDAVVAVFIQFAPPAFRDEIFAGMKRTVRPGGVVLLHGYTPKQLEYRTGGPSAVEQLYTEALLRAAFGDWDLLRIEAYERELDEGQGHKGPSAVIDMIARRPEG